MRRWRSKFNRNYDDGFRNELNFEIEFYEADFIFGNELSDDGNEKQVWREGEYFAPYRLSDLKR